MSDQPVPTPDAKSRAAAETASVAEVGAAVVATRRATADDPLLGCLVFLARYFERPRTAESLRAELPEHVDRMNASLFVRAASRANLQAQAVKRSLDSLTNEVLPAVLITEDAGAVVLLKWLGEGGRGLVLVPREGGAPREADLSEIKDAYAGYAILVKPQFRGLLGDAGRRVGTSEAWWWGPMASNLWIYGQVILAAIMVNLFAIATPLFIMAVYDRVLPNDAIDTLWVLAIGATTVYVFDFIMRTLRGVFVDTAGARMDVIGGGRIFDRILDLKMASAESSSGKTANTVREFESLREFLTSATLTSLVDLPFVFLFIAVLWIIAGPVALVLVLAIVAVLVVGVCVQVPLTKMVRRSYAASEAKHTVLVETVAGLETIKQVGAHGRMRKQWEESLAASADWSRRARALSLVGVNFTQFAQQMSMIGVIVVGVLAVREGTMSAGALIACVMLTGRTLAPLAQVAQLGSRFNQAIAAYKAITELMRKPVERPEDRDLLNRDTIEGAVEFRAATFAYPGSDTGALTQVSFSVKPGERVGLVGRVGSGKSTLLKLLMGLYEPTDGAVLIDGIDMRQLDPADVRHAIGAVPQEPILFRGTVRENIATAVPWADDLAVVEAAKAAGIHEFLAKHPVGYELKVGERGQGLSGGQRQAVALARALIVDPSILILDEPTSAMDNTTEAQLKAQLRRVVQGRTLFLVTHRLGLLELCDRIIVIEGGRVVSDGPRDTVIAALTGAKPPAKPAAKPAAETPQKPAAE